MFSETESGQRIDAYDVDSDATDEVIMEQSANQYVLGLPRASTNNAKRDLIKDHIFNCGFIYDRKLDHYTNKI